MNVLDIIFLVLLVLFGVSGYRRGLAKVLMRLAAAAVSIILARFASAPLSDFIYNVRIHNIVAQKLLELMPSGSVGGTLESLIESVLQALPEGTEQIVDYLHLLPADTLNTFYTTTQIETQYVQPIITKVLVLITTVILFSVISFILMLAVTAIDRHYFQEKDGFISKLNRVGGLFIGIIRGVIPIGILAVACIIVAPLLGNREFSDFVSESLVCNLASNYLSNLF